MTHVKSFSKRLVYASGRSSSQQVSTRKLVSSMKKHDRLVKIWLYRPLNKRLLQMILKKRVTDCSVWKSLEDLFWDNK